MVTNYFKVTSPGKPDFLALFDSSDRHAAMCAWDEVYVRAEELRDVKRPVAISVWESIRFDGPWSDTPIVGAPEPGRLAR